jgi:hypothetical protein
MADMKHSRADTVDHVVEILKKDANAAYGGVVKQAKATGFHVYPLIMGLAKNKLGLGKTKRGPGKPRGPGRPAGSGRPGRPGRAASNGRVFTGELVRAIERLQNDSAAMGAALREIAKVAARF